MRTAVNQQVSLEALLLLRVCSAIAFSVMQSIVMYKMQPAMHAQLLMAELL